MNAPKNFTHYAYLSGPDNMREPTGLLDLSKRTTHERRRLVHVLVNQGELLAAVPWGVRVSKMSDLRSALKWLASRNEPKSGA